MITVGGFQAEKALIRQLYDDLDSAEAGAITDVLCDKLADDYLWRGFHPFNELTNAREVAEQFWQPLRNALTHMQRRQDIFIAGRNKNDGFASTWVASMVSKWRISVRRSRPFPKFLISRS